MLDKIETSSSNASGNLSVAKKEVGLVDPSLDGLAVSVAAYVIGRYFGVASIELASVDAAGEHCETIELDGSQSAASAGRQLDQNKAGAISDRMLLTPCTGDRAHRYVLTSNVNGNASPLDIRGPMEALDRITLAAMAQCIAAALAQAKRDPDVSLEDLDLAATTERAWLTGEGAGRGHRYDQSRTIAQRFADQAARTPYDEAIAYGDLCLLYGELDELVNGFAHDLVAAGAVKGDPVPVLLKNSPELSISLLALMQIGAPFIIVDTSWPAERIARVLERLNPAVLVSDGSAGPDAFTGITNVAIRLDAIAPRRDSVERLASHVPVTADDVMYGLFTSGSTGEPKCALNYHRGILNRFDNMTRRFDPAHTHTILQTSKHIYDGVLWQLFWPLTFGAKVVMPEHSDSPNPEAFVSLIGRHDVSMTDFVPSIFKLVLRYLQNTPSAVRSMASLRRVLVGGEKISASDIAAYKELCPATRFTNTYGPTEASIGMIMHDVPEDHTGDIPLGRPIDNTYSLILDQQGRLLPKGMVGELVIAGDCLGAGYLNNEDATRASFIDNPFASVPSQKLYRTGDLAYLMANNCFQFAGRIDDQVCIGGARVEVSEVELAIASLDEVTDVTVIPRESRAGTTQLVAFVVVSRGRSDAVDYVMDGARQILPRNYLPHRIEIVDEIPLMENGKTNRQFLLSTLVAEQKPGRGDACTTLTPLEKKLAAVWSEILNRSDIAPTDEFFDIGGDSLLALLLIVEVKHRFDVTLTLEDFFLAPSLGAQATLIDGGEKPVVHDHDPQALQQQLHADAQLPLSEPVIAPRTQRPPRKILLTGVTGFVGSHLAAAVLENPDTTLVCPVRGASEYSCIARVASTLASHSFWQQKFIDRIRVVPTNLAEPAFGLGQAAFDELLEGVDAAILNAAHVHVLHDYRSLKPVNVDSVRDVLAHSLHKSGLPVHFISSLSIFSDQSGNERLVEDTVPEVAPNRDGYAQSKWVADRLCLAASRAGAPVSVYRLGEMMSPLRTGLGNETALSTHLLSTVLKLGVYPTKRVSLDYTPVDVGARITVRAVLDGLTNKAYHICNNQPLGFGELSAMIASGLGRESVPYSVPDQEFLDRLAAACAKNPLDRDLRYVHELLPDRAPENGILSVLFTQNATRCETGNVSALMAMNNSQWPELNTRNLIPTSHFFARRMLDSDPTNLVAAGFGSVAPGLHGTP